MAAKTKKRITRKQRSHKALRDHPTEEERQFCELLAAGKSVAEATAKVGWKNPETQGYAVLRRPRVARLLAKLQEKVETKLVEKAAEKIVLSLDLADDRLSEILQAPRIDGVRVMLTRMVAKKAMKAMDQPPPMQPPVAPAPGEAEKPKDAAPVFDVNAVLDRIDGLQEQKIPVDDFALIKAVELAYKRKGGFPGQAKAPSATAQAMVAIVQHQSGGGEGVYRSKWIREQKGINDPESAAVEQQLGLDKYLTNRVVTRGTELAAEAVGTENPVAGGGAKQSG